MYKKITHHIVEEHFDHPIAAELKKHVDKSKIMSAVDYMGRVLDPSNGKPMVDPKTGKFVYANKPKLHPNKKYDKKSKSWVEVYDLSPLSQIEKDSINYWAQLAWRIRSIVISITSGVDDVDSLKTKLSNDIANISTIVEEGYGKDASTQFNTLLTTLALALADVFVRIKSDKDTTDQMTVLGDATKALGDFLETANKEWPSSVVVEILTEVENSYIMQAISLMKKEYDAANTAADNAYSILVLKQDNDKYSFADIFSHGVLHHLEETMSMDENC